MTLACVSIENVVECRALGPGEDRVLPAGYGYPYPCVANTESKAGLAGGVFEVLINQVVVLYSRC